jgi:hypothetical protein
MPAVLRFETRPRLRGWARRNAGSSGLWRSLVARFVWDEDVAGSNPVSPTNSSTSWGSCCVTFGVAWTETARMSQPTFAVVHRLTRSMTGGWVRQGVSGLVGASNAVRSDHHRAADTMDRCSACCRGLRSPFSPMIWSAAQ